MRVSVGWQGVAGAVPGPAGHVRRCRRCWGASRPADRASRSGPRPAAAQTASGQLAGRSGPQEREAPAGSNDQRPPVHSHPLFFLDQHQSHDHALARSTMDRSPSLLHRGWRELATMPQLPQCTPCARTAASVVEVFVSPAPECSRRSAAFFATFMAAPGPGSRSLVAITRLKIARCCQRRCTGEELAALDCQCRALPSNVAPRNTRPRLGAMPPFTAEDRP